MIQKDVTRNVTFERSGRLGSPDWTSPRVRVTSPSPAGRRRRTSPFLL